jgi:hypothetical protein
MTPIIILGLTFLAAIILLYPPLLALPRRSGHWQPWRIHYASFTLASGRPSGFGGMVFRRPGQEIHVILTPAQFPPDLNFPN